MPLWSVTADFSDQQGQNGQSDWAVEAHNAPQAEALVTTRLSKEGLNVRHLSANPASQDQRRTPAFQGIGTTQVAREAARRWASPNIHTKVEITSHDLTDGQGPDWLPPGIWQALFAPDDGARVYAVLDGHLWEQTGEPLSESLAEAGLSARCLYDRTKRPAKRGAQTEDDMLAHAPWLVDLTIEPGTTRPPSQIHLRLFNGLWPTNIGIYLRSPVDLAEMHGRLRKLTKVQDQDGQWYFNRFWEPEFFLFFILFLKDRGFLAPLADVTGFALQIEGDLVCGQTDLTACADAPRDVQGDLDRIFDAGTAMVALRQARKCERIYKRQQDPDTVFEFAMSHIGLNGMDYRFVEKFIEISYALLTFYGPRAADVLPPDYLGACFDEEGEVTSAIQTLHGLCVFGLRHDIAPGKLPTQGVY